MKTIVAPPWVDLLKAYLDPNLTDQERAVAKFVWNHNTRLIKEASDELRADRENDIKVN